MKPSHLLPSVLLLSLLLILQSGCSSTRSARGAEPGKYANPATWLRAAKAMEDKGDLQAAMFNLRVARTVSRRDRKINAAIERVETKIANLSDKKMGQGNRAVRQGRLTRAKRYYLQVLSINPKHKEALEALRKIDMRASMASMKKKVARSTNNYNGGKKKKSLANGYPDEAYAYSRQAILQAGDKQTDPTIYIKEIEAHLTNYPKDKEVRELLSKTLLKQIDKAFESENYNDALRYIEQTERVFNSDNKRLSQIQQQRKAYGKKLYIKGVRSARDEPKLAITYWEYALQFDPEDEKSRLRLRNIQSM
jgi:predicted house-cleaning noncanonical NTP pyrophosphatase (MazG superfamily)